MFRMYDKKNYKCYVTFCCKRCILTEGGTDKNHPGQNLPDKRQKPQDKNPREQLSENLYSKLLSGLFVLGLLKVGGPRCGTYFWGWVLGCVTKCDKGRGVKIGQK